MTDQSRAANTGGVTVRVFADLRKLTAPETLVTVDGAETVAAILGRLGIPEEKAAITLRNARHVDINDTVGPGDVLAVFPPVGGG